MHLGDEQAKFHASFNADNATGPRQRIGSKPR